METETTKQEELDKLKMQENPLAAILSGLIVAVLVAILWGVLTVVTRYQIGYMAIGVGFAVGFTVRKFGKGFSPFFGFIGAGLSLFGCLLGNLLSIAGFLSTEVEGASVFNILGVIFSTPSYIFPLMQESFHPMDVLFYGLALYWGYKYSFYPDLSVKQEEQKTKEMEEQLENRE